MSGLPPFGGNPLSSLVSTLQNIQQSIQSLEQTIKQVFPGTYTTGTWTPQLLFGGAHTGMTTSTASGTYTQLGREVTVRFRIVLTAKGSSTGAATISGLPFPANADVTGDGNAGACPVYSGMASITESPVLTVAPSASVIQLLTFGAAASAALDDTNFNNATTINGTVTYFT